MFSPSALETRSNVSDLLPALQTQTPKTTPLTSYPACFLRCYSAEAALYGQTGAIDDNIYVTALQQHPQSRRGLSSRDSSEATLRAC